MNTKQIEALKLALEALKQIDEAMPFPVAKLAQQVIREALAEQETVLPGGGHVPAVPVAVYGYCPECGGVGVMRERRPNGDDKCTNGHKYPSSKALAEQPAQPEQCECPACKVTPHASDCAVHNEPAYPKGACDCGAQPYPDNFIDALKYDVAKRDSEAQQAYEDAFVNGTGVMLGDKRIDPASIYKQPEPDNTYNYAKNLAEAMFKRHFASDEHYASGRVVWGVNDTVIGILTQIDNMVADMVRKPEQEPVAWLHTKIEGVAVPHRPADLDKHPDRWEALYKTPPPCPTCEALARTVMLDQTSHDTTPPQPEPVIDKSAAVRIATSLGWEPKRKPLTDEEIGRVAGDSLDAWSCARAIEAAHGIGEKPDAA